MTHVAVTPTSGHSLILGVGHPLHPAMWTVVVTCCSDLRQNLGSISHFNRDTMTHVAVTPTSGHSLILRVVHPLHPAMWTVVVTCCSDLRQNLGSISHFNRHYESRGGNAHFRSQSHLGGGSPPSSFNSYTYYYQLQFHTLYIIQT